MDTLLLLKNILEYLLELEKESIDLDDIQILLNPKLNIKTDFSMDPEIDVDFIRLNRTKH